MRLREFIQLSEERRKEERRRRREAERRAARMVEALVQKMVEMERWQQQVSSYSCSCSNS